MSKNSGAEKKIVPKFSAPLKGKSVNQTQQTKFVPPNLKATSSGNAKSEALQEKKNANLPAPICPERTEKTQEYKKLSDIFKPTGNISKNSQGHTSDDKTKKQETPKLYQRDANTVSRHPINKKATDMKESASKSKTLEQKTPDSKTKSSVKGKSREKIYVRKEMSSSEESSSESSNESCQELSSQELQGSHGQSSVSNMCLSQGRDGNLYLSLSGSTTPLLLSQPPAEYCQRERMEWLRSRRDVGVWVQCCKPQCSKWRYLEKVKDPIDVPAYWVCDMNDDPKYNNCDKAEKGPTISEQVDLIDNKYTAGSVVWARLTGFPWWPAIVDDDPDVEAYYWLNGFSDIPTYYHVAFFDKEEVTRAWITPENLKRFTEKDEISRPWNRTRGSNYTQRIEFAKQVAIKALREELPTRLHKYGFLARFKGPIGKNINPSNGKVLSKLQSHMNKEKSLSKAKKQEEKLTIEKRKSYFKENEKVKKKLKRKEDKKSKSNMNKEHIKKGSCHSVKEMQTNSGDKSQANNDKLTPVRSNEIGNDESKESSASLNLEDLNNDLPLTLRDDFDPFLEIDEEGNSEAIPQNTVDGSDKDFCSNMATVGTDCNVNRKHNPLETQPITKVTPEISTVGTDCNVNRKHSPLKKPITKVTPEMSRVASCNITKQEADTSSNVCQPSLNSNNSTSQSMSNNGTKTLNRSEESSTDAVVPDIPQSDIDDGNTSDPFEEDD